MFRTVLISSIFLFVAGCSGSGPSESEVKDALQNDYTARVQDQVDQMAGLFGEKRAKETVFSANGIGDLSELEVTSLSLEDVRELDSGDQLAKVVYTLHRGKKEEKLAERLTLTQLEGHWKIIKHEMLQ